MTTTINITISILIIIILSIYNINNNKQNKKIIKKELYKKIKKIKVLFYLISIFLLFIFLILNLASLGNAPSTKEIITGIINAISVALIALPISLETLYLDTFNNEEDYTHIKTIVTNVYDKNLIEEFNKAHINVILLLDKNTKLKTIKEEKITFKILSETIQIKTNNLNILDKYIDKETTKKEFKDLKSLYEKIYSSRGIHDNYIRTIKYLIATYCPIIFSYLFLDFMDFPLTYNILLISILKLITTLSSRLIYKHLPYEKDIMNRQVKPSNIVIPKQELFLLIIDCFIIFFGLTLPYTYVLAKGAGILFGNTLYFVLFSIINIFLPYYYLSDSSFIINIIKNIKNIRIHIFTTINIIFIIFINNSNYFLTRNIKIHNNIGCLIISITILVLLEIPKLARLISKKGRKKYANNNN